MTPLVSLWLPILLSAVGVFLASSVLHMFTGWHKSDYLKVPNEDRLMDTLRPLAIPPGDYMMPRPTSTQEMKSPAFVEKFKKGPVMMFTVMPAGSMAMGKNLAEILANTDRLIAQVQTEARAAGTPAKHK